MLLNYLRRSLSSLRAGVCVPLRLRLPVLPIQANTDTLGYLYSEIGKFEKKLLFIAVSICAEPLQIVHRLMQALAVLQAQCLSRTLPTGGKFLACVFFFGNFNSAQDPHFGQTRKMIITGDRFARYSHSHYGTRFIHGQLDYCRLDKRNIGNSRLSLRSFHPAILTGRLLETP